jgi:tRNA pseudouridine13 synthase
MRERPQKSHGRSFSCAQLVRLLRNSILVAPQPDYLRVDRLSLSLAIFSSCWASMDFFSFINPPCLTADAPGIGGKIKQEPEDFEVEEIPAYEPCGSGDHLFLWIEKRGLGAEFFIRQVAKRLGISPGDVGSAGLKDRHAITRQFISVPVQAEADLSNLEGNGIRVLHVGRHGNKLRPGHLRGNRFRIFIRGADASGGANLIRALDRIRAEGLPNFYGPQRFGRDGETVQLGMKLLTGTAGFVRQSFLRKLALSAAQSLLFNAYVAQRLADGLLRRVLPGDVMAKRPAGGMFTAEDLSAEQERFDRRETVHAGPMFGRKTFPAGGEAAEREATILEAAGLKKQSFDGFGKLLQGTRRHNIVYFEDLLSAWEPEGLRLTFSLPAGSYATVLLREIMKCAVPDDEPMTDD